jgi:hypothetical protein
MTANKVPPDTIESFDATEAQPHGNAVRWLANARWVRTPEGASSKNAGAQFAAIVAQRSGLEPTTQWA